jgi:hypothetical protein
MKANQVEKLLNGIFNKFLDSIQDELLRGDVAKDAFIAGGCIPSMLADEFVNDFDIYFADVLTLAKVQSYYLAEEPNDVPFHVVLITKNAINLSDKIQLVTRFHGSPEEVVEKFDWAHIKSFFYRGKLYLDKDVYRLIAEKELIYTGSDYPLSSMFRLRKYLKKGWNVSTQTMAHIALDITKVLSRKRVVISDIDTFEKAEELKDDGIFEEIKDFDVDLFLEQVNGVDPLLIQARLEEFSGQRLSIREIIRRLEDE